MKTVSTEFIISQCSKYYCIRQIRSTLLKTTDITDCYSSEFIMFQLKCFKSKGIIYYVLTHMLFQTYQNFLSAVEDKSRYFEKKPCPYSQSG